MTAAKLVNEKGRAENALEVKLPPLRDPATLSKLEFRTALQDSIANPIYEHKRGGRPPTRALGLDVYVVVKEGKPEEQHHHAAVKLFNAKHLFLPFKLAMRYLHCTTVHKPVVDRKPELWARDGRKWNLHEESQEPFQASAWNQHRESSMAEPFAVLERRRNVWCVLNAVASVPSFCSVCVKIVFATRSRS